MLRFNYSIRAHEFLNDPERAQKLRWMKEMCIRDSCTSLVPS